mmetsp:Transcript_11044/g.16269  ORF Transcript_11044/g.16269 Transcript_11044/m.16269 type:complete len:347 (-) Transcript_11044:65-1105(-)
MDCRKNSSMLNLIIFAALLASANSFTHANSFQVTNSAKVQTRILTQPKAGSTLIGGIMDSLGLSGQGSEKATGSKRVYSKKSGTSEVVLQELNSWSCTLGRVNIAVDPVFETLDFGLPALYKAERKVLDNDEETQVVGRTADLVIISQNLPDHCSPKTLGKLKKLLQETVKFIAPPSAESILKGFFSDDRLIILSPGESTEVTTPAGGSVTVRATEGALLGPPWQQKENGYILSGAKGPSIYYEPHCMFDPEELKDLQADYVITPVVAQELPFFTLVDGMEKSLVLASTLKAKAVIPLMNAALESSGALDAIISSRGSLEGFKDIVQKKSPKLQVIDFVPGKPIKL